MIRVGLSTVNLLVALSLVGGCTQRISRDERGDVAACNAHADRVMNERHHELSYNVAPFGPSTSPFSGVGTVGLEGQRLSLKYERDQIVKSCLYHRNVNPPNRGKYVPRTPSGSD